MGAVRVNQVAKINFLPRAGPAFIQIVVRLAAVFFGFQGRSIVFCTLQGGLGASTALYVVPRSLRSTLRRDISDLRQEAPASPRCLFAPSKSVSGKSQGSISEIRKSDLLTLRSPQALVEISAIISLLSRLTYPNIPHFSGGEPSARGLFSVLGFLQRADKPQVLELRSGLSAAVISESMSGSG